jgi:putative nucleotidyltransferase with HDIG domain
MSRRLGASIAAITLVSAVLLVCVVFGYPLDDRLAIYQSGAGVLAGLLFWIGLAVAASSLAVRLPGGILVDVSSAPIVAAMNLGGPAAAAWVSLVGTTQRRELRGKVPWYGVVANHCGVVTPAVLGAVVLRSFPIRSEPPLDFVATMCAAAVLFSVNTLITSAFTSLRTGEPLLSPLRAAAGAFGSLLALGPIGWLMAQVYLIAGWWAVLLFAMPLYTTRLAYSRFVEVREMFTETVRSLAEAVDKRDKYTSGHSHRVQAIAMDMGRVLKCNDQEIEALEWGGLLHDIGKIGVPDSVLLKTERLTRNERTLMNSHPAIGAEIIAPVHRLAPEIPIIRHHHEWFNGSGYPDRLVGDDIPRLARILHVADAFEAMTAARPYRMTPLTSEQAVAELRKFGGIQFDPDMVDAFVRTKWAKGVRDPGRAESPDLPMIGQAAGELAIVGGAAPSGAGTPDPSPKRPATV